MGQRWQQVPERGKAKTRPERLQLRVDRPRWLPARSTPHLSQPCRDKACNDTVLRDVTQGLANAAAGRCDAGSSTQHATGHEKSHEECGSGAISCPNICGKHWPRRDQCQPRQEGRRCRCAGAAAAPRVQRARQLAANAPVAAPAGASRAHHTQGHASCVAAVLLGRSVVLRRGCPFCLHVSVLPCHRLPYRPCISDRPATSSACSGIWHALCCAHTCHLRNKCLRLPRRAGKQHVRTAAL